MWALWKKLMDDIRALINTVINNLNTKLDNIANDQNTKLDNIIGPVNATGGSATTGGANAKLNTLIGRIPGVGMVKSVQRGTSTGNLVLVYYDEETGVSTYRLDPRTINISAINPAKCLVNIHGYYVTSASTYSANFLLPLIASLSSTVLTIKSSLYTGQAEIRFTATEFSWEIVEFY